MVRDPALRFSAAYGFPLFLRPLSEWWRRLRLDLQPFQQFRRPQLKCLRQVDDHGQRRIPMPPLQIAQVRHTHPSTKRQFLLR